MFQADIRINETRILSTVWMNPGISRIGLARDIGLHKSTVTKIVNSLIDEKLLILSDTPDILSTKGRRPTGLYVNDGLGVVIGIEVQTDSWNGVILELNGKVVDNVFEKYENGSKSLPEFMRGLIDRMVRRAEKTGRKVLGAGLGLAGQIDPYGSVIIYSNPLGVYDPLDFRKEISGIYPFPVLIENDANCCCWNVFLEKRSNRERNFLCILGEYRRTGLSSTPEYMSEEGVAVGMGIVIRDNVLHGDKFTVGEFQSVFKTTPNATQFEIDPDEIKMLQKDRELRLSMIRELARNAALLVNVLGLSLIKVFGNFISEPEEMTDIFENEVQDNWVNGNRIPAQCRIEISDNGKEAVAIGAGAYFMYRVFSSPDLWLERDMADPSGVELLRMAYENQ